MSVMISVPQTQFHHSPASPLPHAGGVAATSAPPPQSLPPPQVLCLSCLRTVTHPRMHLSYAHAQCGHDCTSLMPFSMCIVHADARPSSAWPWNGSSAHAPTAAAAGPHVGGGTTGAQHGGTGRSRRQQEHSSVRRSCGRRQAAEGLVLSCVVPLCDHLVFRCLRPRIIPVTCQPW